MNAKRTSAAFVLSGDAFSAAVAAANAAAVALAMSTAPLSDRVVADTPRPGHRDVACKQGSVEVLAAKNLHPPHPLREPSPAGSFISSS